MGHQQMQDQCCLSATRATKFSDTWMESCGKATGTTLRPHALISHHGHYPKSLWAGIGAQWVGVNAPRWLHLHLELSLLLSNKGQLRGIISGRELLLSSGNRALKKASKEITVLINDLSIPRSQLMW